MSLTGAALIAGGASLLGTIGSSLFGKSSQDSANKQNMEIAKYQAKENERMWNMTNEYNSPVAQMERLKSAGLNPNLVYGNGSAANTASAPPAHPGATVQPYRGYNLGTGEAVQAYMNMRANGATVANLEQQNSNLQAQESFTRAQASTELLRQLNMTIKNSSDAFTLNMAKSMMPYTLEGAALSNQKMVKDMQRTDSEITMNKVRSLLIESQTRYSEKQIEQAEVAIDKLYFDMNMATLNYDLNVRKTEAEIAIREFQKSMDSYGIENPTIARITNDVSSIFTGALGTISSLFLKRKIK